MESLSQCLKLQSLKLSANKALDMQMFLDQLSVLSNLNMLEVEVKTGVKWYEVIGSITVRQENIPRVSKFLLIGFFGLFFYPLD